MHFRLRKNVVQLIRNTYDPTTKRAVATVVARMPLSAPALTDELAAQLTTEEAAEVRGWIESQHRAMTLHQELAALELPKSMELAAQWFENRNGPQVGVELAPQILQAWQRLRLVLKRRGLID